MNPRHVVSLALAATLSFTLPTTTAKVGPSGEPTACDGGAPIRQLAGWRILAQVQSRTWLDSLAWRQDNSAAWSRLWPRVNTEGSPRQVLSASSKHLPNGGAGQRITVTVPDSLDGLPVIGYWVETFNDSLWRSCQRWRTR